MKNIFLIILLSINSIIFSSEKKQNNFKFSNEKEERSRSREKCFCKDNICTCYGTPVKNKGFNSESDSELSIKNINLNNSNSVKYKFREEKYKLLMSSDKKNNNLKNSDEKKILSLNDFALNHLQNNEKISPGSVTPKKDDLFSNEFKNMTDKEKEQFLNNHLKFKHHYDRLNNPLIINNIRVYPLDKINTQEKKKEMCRLLFKKNNTSNTIIGEFGDLDLSEKYNSFINKK